MATIFRNGFLLSTFSRRPYLSRYCSNHGSKSSESTIGFVGLGNMGGPMAKNLIDSGHNVLVYDIFPQAVDELKEHGALSAESPAVVASKANRIITMLPSSPQVLEVYNGDNGILKTVQENALLVDCSTIDPSIAKEMCHLAKTKNATYMDSPVSGGTTAAKGATLTFMVGGDKERFDQANTILQHMGKNVIHTGPVGTGQAAKICNNMLLAISMIGVSEAMNLGMSLGLDPHMIAKIINSSSGRCWSSDTYNPCPGVIDGVPSSNNYQGGFMTGLMAKDLGLAQNASTSTRTPTPMGSLAHQIYRIMCNKGYSNLDFGSVFKYLQNEEKSK